MKSTISLLKRGCRAVFIDRRIPSAVLDGLASGARLAARARLAVTNQFYRLLYRFSIPIPPAELMQLRSHLQRPRMQIRADVEIRDVHCKI